MNAVPVGLPFASGSSGHPARSGAGCTPATAGTVRAGRNAVARLGQAKLRALEGRLSERDRAVLQTVRELRLMTSPQLEVLHFADAATPLTAARKARRSLQRLADQGLLRRLERLIGGLHAGSAAYVYALTAAGQRLLTEPGARPRRHEPSLPFVAHTLAIADLYVGLQQRGRQAGVWLLDLQTEPRCWRSSTGLSGERQLLRPDLYLAATVGRDELRWFIEVDLGSEHRPALIRKARAYQRYYDSGVEQTQNGIFPLVAWVVPDRRRSMQLIQALESERDLTGELFAVMLADETAERLTE